MEIHIDTALVVSLKGADNLREFKTSVALDETHSGAVQTALQGIAEMDDGHAWVFVDWLRDAASAHRSSEWDANFSAMLDFAESKGWMKQDPPRVRSHIEWS